MSNVSDELTKRMLEAAGTLFARHGFHRASMADIAREAGISRATLYLRFSDKKALLEALAASLITEVLNSAEAAWRADADLAENLEATILAKELIFFRLLVETPHGAELLAVDAELTRTHAERLDREFSALLTRRGEEAAERGFNLAVFGGPSGFGAFLSRAGAGLKHEARTESEYRTCVRQLSRVVARASAPSGQV